MAYPFTVNYYTTKIVSQTKLYQKQTKAPAISTPPTLLSFYL